VTVVSRGEKLDGVAEQVRQRLNDPVAVAPERSDRRFRHDPDARLIGHRLQAFPRLVMIACASTVPRVSSTLPDSMRSRSRMSLNQPDQAIGVGDGDLQHPLSLLGDRAEQPAAQQASAPRIEVRGVRSS